MHINQRIDWWAAVALTVLAALGITQKHYELATEAGLLSIVIAIRSLNASWWKK